MGEMQRTGMVVGWVFVKVRIEHLMVHAVLDVFEIRVTLLPVLFQFDCG